MLGVKLAQKAACVVHGGLRVREPAKPLCCCQGTGTAEMLASFC